MADDEASMTTTSTSASVKGICAVQDLLISSLQFEPSHLTIRLVLGGAGNPPVGAGFGGGNPPLAATMGSGTMVV